MSSGIQKDKIKKQINETVKQSVEKDKFKRTRDLPGSPVDKIPYFHCKVHRFDLWSGNYDPACCIVQSKSKTKNHAVYAFFIYSLKMLTSLITCILPFPSVFKWTHNERLSKLKFLKKKWGIVVLGGHGNEGIEPSR